MAALECKSNYGKFQTPLIIQYQPKLQGTTIPAMIYPCTFFFIKKDKENYIAETNNQIKKVPG